MAIITATPGTLKATARRHRNHHHHHHHHINHQPTTPFSFLPSLKIPYKPPLKPYNFQRLTFASLNPNFDQIPSQKSPFLSKLTKSPSPHHLETLQYLHDNLSCTLGPLFFASLSSTNPFGPLKAGLAKWVEFFGPLKTTLWAFIAATMAKVLQLFGSISGGDNPSWVVKTPLWPAVAAGLAKWLDIYSGVLMVRILLGWFPNMPWERQPFSAIRDLCDPFLSLSRSIIPPINNIDISPLLAFAVLGTLGSILGNAQALPVS